jgi:hypothetical protein
MAFTHSDYRFSITIYSEDRAVVNALRALSQISQREGNVRIPWGGTKDADWNSNGHAVTFRFTSAAYRQGFADEVERVLRPGLWRELRRSDSDSATPRGDRPRRQLALGR